MYLPSYQEDVWKLPCTENTDGESLAASTPDFATKRALAQGLFKINVPEDLGFRDVEGSQRDHRVKGLVGS